eukprot:SAG11_NODE_35226_length_267_cov_1.529762_1_plen_40_part_10
MQLSSTQLAAFVTEAQHRGWGINFSKTVLGAGFYATTTEA